jgi:catechol 2,3-dioxygenase-like lactoylglutathione lyase family enzyme
MPLGDPMGGETYYLERGQALRVWLTAVPVSNLACAIDFYSGAIGLELQVDAREQNWVELGPPEPASKILLYVPKKEERRQPGGPTGVVLETDSIFEFHRRLIDEEVPFLMKPERRPWGGLMAIFLDDDGNELTVVEDPDHYARHPKPPEVKKLRPMERTRTCSRP